MNKLEAVGKWHESQVVAEELRSVATMRIDTLSKTLAPLTVVKIDVEGAEAEALETISNYRATMLVEGPRELKDSMRAFFEKYDYVILDGGAEHQSPLQDPVWDTVAVSREKFAKHKST